MLSLWRSSYATEMEPLQAYYEAYGGQEMRWGIAGRRRRGGNYADIPFVGRFAHLAGRSAYKYSPAAFRWQRYIAARDAEFDRSYLAPSLRHFIAARDLCPLLGKPHARLAAHKDLVPVGDSSEQYMDRVRYLRRFDPEVWYISGLLDLADHRPEQAWANWKRSLELSDGFATEIARRAMRVLLSKSC